MDMHTKAEKVTGTISIWAVPKDPAYLKPGERPFNYELKDSSSYHWKTGAVCVHTDEVSMELPGGINLYIKAIETLEAAKKSAFDEYMRKQQELDKQIDQLRLLTAMPEAPAREETILEILMRRDNMDRAEAEDRIAMAREQVAEGADPEEILREEFGLEPDYIYELLGEQ